MTSYGRMNAQSSWKAIYGFVVARSEKPLDQSLGRLTYCTSIFDSFLSFFRAKHPTKVHVWAGISMKGRTAICIFDGLMNQELFVNILSSTLLPSINALYPDGHRLMMDNDPKHASRYAATWMAENKINWWRTPPESPDFNPIENMWHELKEYQRRVVKPKTKPELINGIEAFWRTVSKEKCIKYIRHLRKVIPKVIELNGCATG